MFKKLFAVLVITLAIFPPTIRAENPTDTAGTLPQVHAGPESEDALTKELVLISFGAIVGAGISLVSAVCLESWRARRRRKELSRAINVELSGLLVRLGWAAYRIKENCGTFDEKFLNWLFSLMESHSESLDEPEIVEWWSKLPKEERPKLIKKLVLEQRNSTPGDLSLKVYVLPFVTSRLSELHSFSPSRSRRVFEIIQRLDLYNQTVHEQRQCFDRTFDATLTERNRTVNDHNLKICYERLGDAAEDLATRIDAFLTDSSPS